MGSRAAVVIVWYILYGCTEGALIKYLVDRLYQVPKKLGLPGFSLGGPEYLAPVRSPAHWRVQRLRPFLFGDPSITVPF